MLLYVIFAQRRCRYSGEYAPKALACQDQWGREDKPSYLDEKLEEYIKSGDFVSVKIIPVEIPTARIDDLLAVSPPPVNGEVP